VFSRARGVLAGLGGHATAQDDRVEAALPELVGEAFDMGGPLGQDQAVPASFPCCRHIVDYLGGAGVVGHEVAVDGGHSARFGGIGVTDVVVDGVVDVQHGCRSQPGLLERKLWRIVG
jgi:hypothetical protein